MQGISSIPPGTPVDPDELTLSISHPDDGRALRYHVDELLICWMGEISEAISKTPEFIFAARAFEADVLMMHIENLLHPELVAICGAYMRRRYLQLVGSPSSKPISCPAGLLALVRDHWLDDAVTLVARHSLVPWVRRIGQKRHALLNAVRRAIRSRHAPVPGHPTIAVEVAEGVDPLRKSDAFWLAAGAVRPEQVLFVFERHNLHILDVERELASARKLGARCVALHSSVSAGGKVPVWVPGARPEELNRFCRSLDGINPSLGAWLPRTLKEFAGAVWRWESFFRYYNVAIYQQFTELSLETAPRRVAADRVNGIEIGKMRSQFFERSSASFYFQHEVAFVWHENVRSILRYARTRTREVVAVGYPWGHLFDTMVPEASALRRELMRPGVTRVVAVYDNGTHLDTHTSATHLEAFYSYLVDLARRRTDIALLVKSKKPQILQAMPMVRASLSDLEAEGRCLVIDKAMVSVVPAALAADLVVAIPAATAGCEAALAGREVVMYDPSGTRDHAFNGAEKGIIYGDLATFSRAVEAALDGGPRRSGGRAACYVDQIDPFRDGRATHRAAAFIAGFLGARQAGSAKGAALGAARARYEEACMGASRGAVSRNEADALSRAIP